MPTEPLRFLLDRNEAIKSQKQFIEATCPLLRELINEGTCVARRCEVTSPFDGYETIAPILIYTQMLELCDGVEVQLSNAVSRPAIPLVRGMFECWLQLAYMLKGDSRRRCLQYLLAEFHSKIEATNRWTASTPDAERRRNELAKLDPELSADNLRAMLPCEHPEKRLEVLMNEVPGLREVEEERKKLRHSKQRFKDWFNLFDGPKDRQKLAEAVDAVTYYDVIYNEFSNVSHGGATLSRLSEGTDGNTMILAMRQPQYFWDAGFFACHFLLDATRLLLRHFRNESPAHWYAREVQEAYSKLAKSPFRVT